MAKIARIRRRLPTSPASTKTKLPTRPPLERPSSRSSTVPLVAIGSSTGGPKALCTILSKLPASFSAAIAIVQHVDANFSAGFVEWLNQQTALSVRLAVAGDRLEVGTILVAGTNDHLYLKPDLTLGYTKEPIQYPSDKTAKLYLERVEILLERGIPENWSGVWAFTEK